MANILHQLSMAASAATPWVDVRASATGSVFTDCEDISSPVGVITLEFSNDVATIEAEKAAGTPPLSTAAKLIANTTVPSGTAWTNGYDGNGAKSSGTTVTAAFAYARIRYARTGGGASDTLNVRWNLPERLGRY